MSHETDVNEGAFIPFDFLFIYFSPAFVLC